MPSVLYVRPDVSGTGSAIGHSFDESWGRVVVMTGSRARLEAVVV